MNTQTTTVTTETVAGTTATDRARQYIDDIKKINSEHGMTTVAGDDAYNAAVLHAAAAYSRVRPTIN